MNNQSKARVFSIFVILSILLSVVGVPNFTAKAASTITFAGQELLGRPTNNSITINIVPNTTIEYHYQYGLTAGANTWSTSNVTATGGQPHEVIITGLSPNTQYFYRMQYHAPGDSMSDWVNRSEHSFRTQRALGDSFTFSITSDSHIGILLGNTTNWTNTLNEVASDHPDFEIDLGDTMSMDSVTNAAGAETAYKNTLQYFNLVSASSPIFLVAGNHEQTEGWHMTASTGYQLPVLATNAMKKFFVNPVPGGFYSGDTNTLAAISDDHLREDYYSWTWGDALFVVIDPYWFSTTKPYTTDPGGGESDTTGSGDSWDWTLGLDQFNWFKTTLQNSSAKYKFVFAHQIDGSQNVSGQADYGHGGANSANLVEMGGYNEAGTTYQWATERSGWGSDPVHQMMVANGVSAFFHGHDHQYAYEQLNGMVYQSVPSASFTGSFGIYTTGNGYTTWADSSQNPGYLKVTVGPSQTHVDFIRTSSGASVYAYDIAPKGPSVNLTTAVSPAGSGTTNPEVGVHPYVQDSIVNVTAAANAGYVFDHWSGGCSGSGTCQVTMNTDKTVTANFVVAPPSSLSYIGDIGTATIKDSGTTDLVITTTAGVVAGDDIIIAYATDPSQDLNITVSDTAGNKYQQAAMGISVGNVRTYVFAAYNATPLASGGKITIHQTVYSSTVVAARAAVVSVFRGLADSGALEQTNVGSGTSTSPSSGAATTIQPAQLLIGAVGTEGPGSDTAGTWQNSFTAGPRAGTTATTTDAEITVSLGWQIVSAAGSYTASKTGITSRDWAAAIATFKTTDAGISYIGDIGSAQSKTTGTSLAVTTTSAVAAGDDIMVTFAMDGNAGGVSVSDGVNTYTQVANAQFTTPGTGNVRTVIFAAYNVNALSSGSAITITHPSLAARSAVVSVFRGLADSGALDQIKTATGTSNTVSSGATSTTTQANELLIGAVGLEGPNVDAPSVWQNSFTYGPRLGTSYGSSSGDDTDITAQMGWRIVGATGAYQGQLVNLNTTRDWAAGIATFKAGTGAPACYALTLSHTGQGSDPSASPLKSASCANNGQYVSGEVISLSNAVPTTGWQISGWTGTANDSSTGATNSLTMPASAKTVSVNYSQIVYTLTTSVVGSGSINRNNAGPYHYNDVVQLTAVPAASWTFSAWSGDLSGNVNPSNITITGNKSVTATFVMGNVAPVAVGETYSTYQDVELDVPAPGVLSNDTDANLDPLTAIKVSDPAHGNLVLNANGSFTYTPAAGFTGDDSFTYKANDGALDSNTVTVTLHVNEGNPPPVLPSSFYGEIHILTNPPSAGQLVEAYVPGVTPPVATTAIKNTAPLTYLIDVPGDVVATPAKDGGVEDDVVTFKINGHVVATGIWHSGTSVRLDFNETTQSISLVPGWNLISFYLHPADTDITEVLSSIASHYDLVYAWNASTGLWMKYDPNAGFGDTLLSLDETMGFWINMNTADTLEISGSMPDTTTIALYAGWNLVSFPSATNQDLPDAFSANGVGSDFSLVYAYHAADTADQWKKFDLAAPFGNDLTVMAPGWGYWIKVSAAHNWVVNN